MLKEGSFDRSSGDAVYHRRRYDAPSKAGTGYAASSRSALNASIIRCASDEGCRKKFETCPIWLTIQNAQRYGSEVKDLALMRARRISEILYLDALSH